MSRTWSALRLAAARVPAQDLTNGPTSARSRLRLFGQREDAVRVTLFRDYHAWCPYCQKVWLWLEEKQVPYRTEKVTMFCYGEKEAWYKRVVPSGMLPAMLLDGRVVTESDVLLAELEEAYGPLGRSLADRAVLPLRRLERALFSAWCRWLCYPASSAAEEARNAAAFAHTAATVEQALAKDTSTPYFLGADGFSVVDVVFTPYIERMAASLFYYKGFTLRDPTARPHITRWFEAMETRPAYRGTQSDAHTHAHDLPPQMGGCYASGTAEQRACAARVDNGPWLAPAPSAAGALFRSIVPDASFPEGDAVATAMERAGGVPADARLEALARMLRFKERVYQQMARSGCGGLGAENAAIDEALRCALALLVWGDAEAPPPGTAAPLRYLRDRISVPRDMSVWAARHLRTALEATAARAPPPAAGGATDAPPRLVPISARHRRDQDPRPHFVLQPRGARAEPIHAS